MYQRAHPREQDYFAIPPRQFRVGQLPPRTIAPRTISTKENCPQVIAPGQLPSRIIDPWTVDP